MKPKELWNFIQTSFKNKEYEITLKYIKKYIYDLNGGIFEELLKIYILCQIRLGYYDEARKNVELLTKWFPRYQNSRKLAIMYAAAGMEKELTNLLNHNPNLDDATYYLLANYCFFNQQYKVALRLYFYLRNNSKCEHYVNEARDYIKRTNKYLEDESIFRECFYSKFKYNGNELEPGHIVYVKGILSNNNDPKKDNRPYMIWQINEDRIYAFSVTTKTNRGYKLYAQNYKNRKFDRKIRNNIVCFKREDVTKVIEKVNEKDYHLVLNQIYQSLYFCAKLSNISSNFIKEYANQNLNPKVGDVIVHCNHTKDFKYFYVFDVDKNSGKERLLEVAKNECNQFCFVDYKISHLNDMLVYKIINLDESTKENLNNAIPSNYLGKKVLGTLVKFNGKLLEVLIAEDDYYICIDRTYGYSNTFLLYEFVYKDSPLFIEEIVPKQEKEKHLEILKSYLHQNSNEFHKRRSDFLGIKKRRTKSIRW